MFEDSCWPSMSIFRGSSTNRYQSATLTSIIDFSYRRNRSCSLSLYETSNLVVYLINIFSVLFTIAGRTPINYKDNFDRLPENSNYHQLTTIILNRAEPTIWIIL